MFVVVIPGTSKFIKMQVPPCTPLGNCGTRSNHYYCHFCWIHLSTYSFVHQPSTHPMTRAGPGALGTLRHEARDSQFDSKVENPPTSKGSLACKNWGMTHSSGLLSGWCGNPVSPDLLIFKENLKIYLSIYIYIYFMNFPDLLCFKCWQPTWFKKKKTTMLCTCYVLP